MLFKNIKAQKFSMGFFGVLSFRPGIFLGFVGIARDFFFGFGFLPPFEHPHHLKSRAHCIFLGDMLPTLNKTRLKTNQF